MKKIHFMQAVSGALLMMALFLSIDECIADNSDSLNSFSGKGVVVASVEMTDISAIFSEKSGWILGFSISSKLRSQPGVRYGVELWSEKRGMLADQVIYPGSILLGENENIQKNINYYPPGYLSGNYEIWIVVKNEKGLLLEQALAKEISISGHGKYILIDPSSCALVANGQSERVPIGSNVNFSRDQSVSLECAATNLIDEAVYVRPEVRTNVASIFGKEDGRQTGESIFFEKGEKKIFRTPLIKSDRSNIFESSLILLNELGRAISNPVNFKFFVDIPNAKIVNAVSDRTAYSKGDTARLSIFWNKSKDVPPLFLLISVASDEGSCSDNRKIALGERAGGSEEVEVPIYNSCSGGKVGISIADESGNVYDEMHFVLGVSQKSVEEAADKSIPIDKIKLAMFGTAVMLLVLGIFLILMKKINFRGTKVFIFIILSGMALCWGDVARGAAVELCYDDNRVCHYIDDIDGYDVNTKSYVSSHTSFCTGNTLLYYENMSIMQTDEYQFLPSAKLQIAPFNGSEIYTVTAGGEEEVVTASYSVVNVGAGNYRARFAAYADFISKHFPFSQYSDVTGFYYRDYSVSDCSGGSTATCGDGSCNGSESCSSCPADCGSCSGCGPLNGTSCGPLESDCPAPAGSNYCENGDYVNGSWSGSYPGYETQWWWQCNNSFPVWCFMNKSSAPLPAASSAPTITSNTCDGVSSLVDVAWEPMSAPFNYYQLRIDTDTNLANGFWWKEYTATSASDVPVGLQGWNGFSASSGSFDYNTIYYAQVAYHPADWSTSVQSPWRSFVASDCCVPGTGYYWGSQQPANCSDKSCRDSASPTNTCMDECGNFVDTSNCSGVPGEPSITPISCGPCAGSYREVMP